MHIGLLKNRILLLSLLGSFLFNNLVIDPVWNMWGNKYFRWYQNKKDSLNGRGLQLLSWIIPDELHAQPSRMKCRSWRCSVLLLGVCHTAQGACTDFGWGDSQEWMFSPWQARCWVLTVQQQSGQCIPRPLTQNWSALINHPAEPAGGISLLWPWPGKRGTIKEQKELLQWSWEVWEDVI